jgi:hypothetical protein
MITKLAPDELKKLTEMINLKDVIYNQIFEMINKAESLAAGIFAMQKDIEQKYNVNLTSKNTKLNLKTGEIEEVILETKSDKVISIDDIKKG